MTNEERRKAAWIVFGYERDMYLELTRLCPPGSPSPFQQQITNACTEARVLHANILCEMLTGYTAQNIYFSIPDMIECPFPKECRALDRVHGEWEVEGTLAHACHFRVKTPGTCRGDSFDYSKILEAIHEPLVAAMDAVIVRRKLQEKAAEVRIDEDRPVQVKLSPDSEVVWCEGGKIVDLGPKPRFAKLTNLKGEEEFVDIAKVMAVGVFDSPGQLSHTRVSFSPDGHYWLVVQESPEEVVAKLEGRA